MLVLFLLRHSVPDDGNIFVTLEVISKENEDTTVTPTHTRGRGGCVGVLNALTFALSEQCLPVKGFNGMWLVIWMSANQSSYKVLRGFLFNKNKSSFHQQNL